MSKNKRVNAKSKNKEKDAKSNKKRTNKKKGFWKKHRKLALFLKICIILFILLIIVGAGAIVALFTNDNWGMNKDDLTLKSVDTVIYDKDGIEIANVSGAEKRRTVPLSEIPKTVQEAYVSIEDKRFFQHKGVDIKRTLGATATYIIHRGHSSYGGSTITQQMIKNLKDDKSDTGIAGIQRKIREMSRAYKVEQMLSKDQILELYLNLIFVGGEGNLHGVELASRYYFNKSVTELNLAESAFLAGINHAPNSYNPFTEKDNSESIKKRTKTVLEVMKDLEKISEEEYNTAKAEVEEGLKFEKGDTATKSSMSYLARAALNQVIEQYAQKNDMENSKAQILIEGGGYKIYTTQDSAIQSTMEEVYRSGDYIYKGVQKDKDGNRINEHTQSAMVIIDNKTGDVVGCMGGLGDDVDSNGQNRATQSVRQPGSSMKPLASIAPALEKGIITAATIYDESPTDFGSYHPTSSNRGLITVREAIKISANTTEVKIMSELTPKNSIAFLRKMGISSLITASENKQKNDENLQLVLGGTTYGISPLEMAGAYATIANDGVYRKPNFYTRVENSSGSIILEPEKKTETVMSSGNAYIEKTILRGPVGSGGTAPYAKVSGQDTGGKTGTTTDNKDRWFCGFTPYYTATTWYGYDNPEDLSTTAANSSNKAARIWIRIMDKIHKELPSKEFEKPSNIVSATICLNSGKVATSACSKTYTEYFVKGTVPKECEGHKNITVCKETGKIANEYCPETEERIYAGKPEKEDTTLWKTSGGSKYTVITETCDVHTKEEATVPHVIGKSKEEAMRILKDLGLTVTVETRESEKEEGTVLRQSKNEGDKVTKGESITITVSKKKEVVEPKNEEKPKNEIADKPQDDEDND